MHAVRRLTPALAEQLRRAPFTYDEVGATAAAFPAGFPPGYHLAEHRAQVGQGRRDLDRAVDKLLHWRMHLDSGLQVASSSEKAVPGEVVLLRLGPGPLSLRIPCRVVYEVAEADRAGFAYGTLPGHPESGEEVFLVELLTSGAVVFTVQAFSRPGTRLARLGGPLSWAVQRRALRRYAAALSPDR
jgi:uncharacterized protein (UPF0548 family)